MRQSARFVGILLSVSFLLSVMPLAYTQNKTTQNSKQGSTGTKNASSQSQGRNASSTDVSNYKLSSQRIEIIQTIIDNYSPSELNDESVVEAIKTAIGKKMPLVPTSSFSKNGAARSELDKQNEKAGYIYDIKTKKWSSAQDAMNQYITYVKKQKDVLYEEAITDYGLEKYDEAVKKLKKAIMLDNTKAKFLLGICYSKGYGVSRNRETAETFFKASIQEIRSSAEKGNATDEMFLAMSYAFGYGSKPHGPNAIEWFKKAAEHGNAQAEEQLGALYEYGLEDLVPQDYREAIKWYKQAAEHGSARAQFALGLRYSEGDLVPQNSKESAKWIRKSAESGYPKAQYTIGLCYLVGEGVAKSDAEAAKWFRKAAEQGHREAEKELKQLERNRK